MENPFNTRLSGFTYYPDRLISIMLGRWRMPVADALKAYEDICDDVFSSRAKNRFGFLPWVPKWNERKLEQKMKNKVKEFTPVGEGPHGEVYPGPDDGPSVFTQMSLPRGLCRV